MNAMNRMHTREYSDLIDPVLWFIYKSSRIIRHIVYMQLEECTNFHAGHSYMYKINNQLWFSSSI